MAKVERVESDALVAAGLEVMRLNGKPLTKIESKGRSRLYKISNGQTVRVRTCNDHVLIIVADNPSTDAKLNIEGTDWLLIIMPEEERMAGKILAYLVPADEAASEARRTHKEWLNTNPGTKGDNRTWNLWFRANGPGKANNYASKWSKYKLKTDASVIPENNGLDRSDAPTNINLEVDQARQRIAKAAGVPVSSVKITIDFVS